MSISSCAEAAEPPPESKLPKAALQQLCQKQQWPTPKFDRLPPGGHRLAHAGMRYSVTLSMPASSGPRKKKVMLALHRFLAEEECKVSLTSGLAIPGDVQESHQISQKPQLAQAHHPEYWLCYSVSRLGFFGHSKTEASSPCRGVDHDCCTAAYHAGTPSKDIHSARGR